MSSSLQANATHQKLSAVKKKLYQEGYRFPMDVESLPLIERLYADLIRAKESLKKAKVEKYPVEVTSTSTVNSEHSDIVYKNENLKLIRENSDLHNQLIKMHTVSENDLLDIKADMKKLERENSELKFLNGQYAQRMKALEAESSQKSERILQLQDKNQQATVHVRGVSKKKTAPFRRQRMEIDFHLPPSEPRSSAQLVDPKTVDLLKISEENISRLKSEAVGLRSEVENLQNKLSNVTKQVEARDKEIARLTKIIDGGNPSDVVMLEAKNRTNQKTINHLNNQIDLLQKQVGDLEIQVGRRRVAWEDEEEDDDDGGSGERRRRRAREHPSTLARLHSELEEKQEEINRLNAELVSKERELRHNMSLECQQRHNYDQLVLKLQQDKNGLATKLSELVVNEKELVRELNKLKHPKVKSGQSCKKVQCRAKPTSDPSLKVVEEERDYYKEEVDTLLRVLSTVSLQRTQGQRSTSPCSHKSSSRANSPLNKNVCSCSTREDRQGGELGRLRKERDDLRRAVENYDKQFQEIQSSIKVLIHERDHLGALYNQTKDELNEKRSFDRDAFGKSYVVSSGSNHPLLRKLEEEKEDALAKIRNLQLERDELLRQIQDMDETILDERGKYDRHISELQAALEDLESKRSATVRSQGHDLRDETAQYKATASQMRLIADQAEETLKEKEATLVSAQAELRAAWMKVDELEKKIRSVEEERTNERDEVEKLRRALERTDRERDELQSELDAKAESEDRIGKSLHAKEKQLRELQAAMSETDSVLSKIKGNIVSKDREVSNLRQQIESLSEDLKFTAKTKDALIRENRKLQEESENMSKDAHLVTKDLQEAVRLKNKLSAQAQEYLNEVRRCQELLSSKEQEKYDILEQYRLLNTDLERVENQNNLLEAEVSKLRIELVNKDSEARRLRETCEHNGRDIQEHVTVERTYGLQLSTLTKSVASLEESILKLEKEKQVVSDDLSTARDFIVRLESEKGRLERQLAVKSFDVEKLQGAVEGKRKEADALKGEMSTCKQQVVDLENLLQVTRTKEWQNLMALEEKQSEAQLLKDRLTLNDNKIESQSKELSYHRSKTVEMESEVEKLKRRIISEKFERERLLQALKMNNISVPEDSRLGAISPESLSRKINSEKVTMSKSEFMKKYNLDKEDKRSDDGDGDDLSKDTTCRQ